MWEHLLASLLLEASGFHLENNYEETLNQYFVQNPEDEFLLELEYFSSDLEKSLNMLKRNFAYYPNKYDGHKFASIICKQLEEIYENTTLKEFVPCAYRLWQILPMDRRGKAPLSDLCYFTKSPAKKDLVRADATYREMFRYYSDNLDDKSVEEADVSIQEFVSIESGSIEPDFEKAEILLGFRLNKSARDFYSKVFAKKIEGEVIIPEEGYTIPIGNERFDTWFQSNSIKGRIKIQLFPCTDLKSSARFIRDHFYMWTGGNNFGERIFIGDFSTGIGQITIVINNQTNAVEWIDCGYGNYVKYDKNPNGILAGNIDQFLLKL